MGTDQECPSPTKSGKAVNQLSPTQNRKKSSILKRVKKLTELASKSGLKSKSTIVVLIPHQSGEVVEPEQNEEDENDLEDIANERGDVSNQYLGKIRFLQILLLILSIIKHFILYVQVV